ncbi:MAG: ABC transporter permease [Chloroflexi bacterium]|nr:ABC transporter permease [Chloroflexota bacterium]
MLLLTRIIQPTYGAAGIDSLARAALPIAFAAVAQAVVVIAGGIDLSVGSMMALTNVAAASMMHRQGEEFGVVAVVLTLILGIALGITNGVLVVVTRVPDIVVTLALSFVWAGAALLVLNTPGGGAAQWLKDLPVGGVFTEWVPSAMVLLLVCVGAVWLPLRRRRSGLALYAVGSDRLAAFRSGVPIARTKVLSYALCGLFSAMGGLALSAATGIGTPTPGPYTLLSVAAIVLGGVSLAGGRGGLLGCIIAVLILRLVRTDLTFLGVDPNYATVIEGLIMVAVVMVGAVVALRRKPA